ncbi:type IV toxin-antitoxin system AbiEi family antitoxin, partial [Acinetobacter baumannii]
MNKQEYKLNNKKELLQRWMVAYEEKLKPALRVGPFRFLKEEDFIHWKKIPLQNMKTWWGAEPAADLFTNYLKPGELT